MSCSSLFRWASPPWKKPLSLLPPPLSSSFSRLSRSFSSLTLSPHQPTPLPAPAPQAVSPGEPPHAPGAAGHTDTGLGVPARGTNLQKSARRSIPNPPHAEHRRHRASQGWWPAWGQGRSPAPGQRSPPGRILLVSSSRHEGAVMDGPPVRCSYCSNYGARGTRCIPRQPNGSSRLLFGSAETRCSRGGARCELSLIHI